MKYTEFLNVLCQTMAHSFHRNNFQEYKFKHIPNYPQTNGEAVKTLLNKNNDPHLALLAYCFIPLVVTQHTQGI